jgi:enoyl-CoA hydratase/carnithine racemase
MDAVAVERQGAVGTHRAMELTLTGRTLSAAEVASWGMVQRVFPDASFASETEALAGKIAAARQPAFLPSRTISSPASSSVRLRYTS